MSTLQPAPSRPLAQPPEPCAASTHPPIHRPPARPPGGAVGLAVVYAGIPALAAILAFVFAVVGHIAGAKYGREYSGKLFVVTYLIVASGGLLAAEPLAL